MKIGNQGAIPPFEWKLRMFSPQPHWEGHNHDAVGSADGKQVQHHCLHRDHDRPE